MKWASVLGFVCSLATAVLSPVGAAPEPRCFPKDFMFGTATAAYQVEGAWNEGGRTPSIWDEFCRDQPGMLCANVADDFYHRYPDDLNLMQDVGLQSLRFSISWSRAMTWDPESRHMRPNPEGIAFYHAPIDAMNARGIVPILTIYHWDLPVALMHELTPNGWLSREIVDHYVEYATLMFNEFGHKVDYWTTFNEPIAFVGYSYGTGMFAPGHKGSPTEAYTVSRNVLVAHAKAVQKFRELKTNSVVGDKARIGIVLVSAYFYPLDPNNENDVAAAKRALDFDFGWFLEPIVTGDYPAVMRERAGDRLPKFTAEESALLKGSYEIFMLNHYYSKAVTSCDSEASKTPCSSLTAGWEADKGVDEDHVMPGTRRHFADGERMVRQPGGGELGPTQVLQGVRRTSAQGRRGREDPRCGLHCVVVPGQLRVGIVRPSLRTVLRQLHRRNGLTGLPEAQTDGLGAHSSSGCEMVPQGGHDQVPGRLGRAGGFREQLYRAIGGGLWLLGRLCRYCGGWSNCSRGHPQASPGILSRSTRCVKLTSSPRRRSAGTARKSRANTALQSSFH